MTGFGILATARKEFCSSRPQATMPVPSSCDIALMSAPAAKTRSPPYRTTARTSACLDTSSAAARTSMCSCSSIAFIFGRSRRMVPTPSSTCSVTNSGSATGPPGGGRTRRPHPSQQPATGPAAVGPVTYWNGHPSGSRRELASGGGKGGPSSGDRRQVLQPAVLEDAAVGRHDELGLPAGGLECVEEDPAALRRGHAVPRPGDHPDGRPVAGALQHVGGDDGRRRARHAGL